MRQWVDKELDPLSTSLNYPVETNPATIREYKNLSLDNLFRMFHCAPAVMKTVLDGGG